MLTVLGAGVIPLPSLYIQCYSLQCELWQGLECAPPRPEGKAATSTLRPLGRTAKVAHRKTPIPLYQTQMEICFVPLLKAAPLLSLLDARTHSYKSFYSDSILHSKKNENKKIHNFWLHIFGWSPQFEHLSGNTLHQAQTCYISTKLYDNVHFVFASIENPTMLLKGCTDPVFYSQIPIAKVWVSNAT